MWIFGVVTKSFITRMFKSNSGEPYAGKLHVRFNYPELWIIELIPNYVLSRKTGFHYRKSSKIRDNFFIMASGGNHNESTDN